MTIVCLSFSYSNTQYDFPIDGSPSRGQAKSSAIIRAQEVRSKLEPLFPSFVKSLLRSHVASCFWMVYSLQLDECDKIANYWSHMYIFTLSLFWPCVYLLLFSIIGASFAVLQITLTRKRYYNDSGR